MYFIIDKKIKYLNYKRIEKVNELLNYTKYLLVKILVKN